MKAICDPGENAERYSRNHIVINKGKVLCPHGMVPSDLRHDKVRENKRIYKFPDGL